MAKTSLVIVESPAKAKTIGKYLGPNYQVKACMGHLRDLPKSTIGVDIEADFEPNYRPIKGKEEIIGDLKKSAKQSEYVYLATDPDREGEAISWHLKELLDLSDEKTKRVTFNEITKRVVGESIAAPREIDQNLVDAQQARRILDRIVGYQISPIMWKKIKPKLSAGRVQSVATRMVDDRDAEIEAFQPQEYWSLDAKLSTDGVNQFTARYFGENGKKRELNSQAEVSEIIAAVENNTFSVKSVKRQDKQRSPSPPFTTSTLQQEASRKLSMTPRRTMAIAQQLYEGVDITGEGTIGLITYMRTDSLRLSDDAQAAAKSFILGRYGQQYYPGAPRVFRTGQNAQDAHEAIRPSDVTLTPEDIKKDLTAEQYRLYRLIWNRFVACQMSNAVYDSVSVEVESAGHDFRASSSHLKFSGYTAVYEEGKDEEKEEKEIKLPELTEGQALVSHGFDPEQHYTQPPAHYTEATLIRAMEEQGIGRPSTYAPTVSTILDRRYVKKEGKHLVITNLGRAVTGWMKRYFADIEDLKFTAGMEEQLDAVENGTVEWKSILREFYFGDFQKNLDAAAEGERVSVQPTVSDEICPNCGKNLVERDGKFGPFLACPGYPDCSFTMPLVEVMPGRCPVCGGRLMKRSGFSQRTNKQYFYYCCEYLNSKDENNKCEFRTWDVPVKDDCPICGQTMFKKSGKGFKKPFCINEQCDNFTPEEKRGGYRKKTADAEGEAVGAEETLEKKAEKKTAKKAEKKPSEKKTAVKKTAAKKATGTKKTTKKASAESGEETI